MDPVPSLLDNVEHYRLLSAAADDLLDLFDDVVGVVTSDACDWLDFVLDRCVGILFGVLKHEIDLILMLLAFVGFAHNVKFIRGSFFNYLELIQINMG